jgi:hypothetical protein
MTGRMMKRTTRRRKLKSTGPDPDASGEAEYEEDADRRAFAVPLQHGL